MSLAVKREKSKGEKKEGKNKATPACCFGEILTFSYLKGEGESGSNNTKAFFEEGVRAVRLRKGDA